MDAEITELIGQTFSKVERVGDEAIHFYCGEKIMFKMLHITDCCESVTIEDINGDLSDLENSPILTAEEITNEKFIEDFKAKFCVTNQWGRLVDKDGNHEPDSFTWTFYKLATIKGYVDIRWYGESNGYYSEGVDITKPDEDGKFTYWD